MPMRESSRHDRLVSSMEDRMDHEKKTGKKWEPREGRSDSEKYREGYDKIDWSK